MIEKNVLVLAKNDNKEAMRVAAGLTISGHRIELVFVGPILSPDELDGEKLELLELSDIYPLTTNMDMKNLFPILSDDKLADKIINSDVVINI